MLNILFYKKTIYMRKKYLYKNVYILEKLTTT